MTRGLLTQCEALGIRLAADCDGLAIDAPRGALTPDLLARLKAQKADLLAMLRADNADAHHGDAGQDLAVPRPRSAIPVAVEWPTAAADFVLLLTADDLPKTPFQLNDWTEVRDAGKMLRSLRGDILRGPSGPRAFYGALQADLLALRRFAMSAHD